MTAQKVEKFSNGFMSPMKVDRKSYDLVIQCSC